MEAEVEIEAVGREIGSQLVRRDPADAFADVRRERRGDLLTQRKHDEQDREPDEDVELAAPDGVIDERAQQLRGDELQPDADHDQAGQNDELRPAGRGVAREQVQGAMAGAHGRSLAISRGDEQSARRVSPVLRFGGPLQARDGVG